MRAAEDSTEDLVDAVMTASRALLAVVARSLAAVDEDVTLPQYRALIVLGQRGAQRPADLATTLAVTPSTATRMCDRLVAKGLIDRDRVAEDRREVRVALSVRGRALVEEVTRRRRGEIAGLLETLPQADHHAVIGALRTFARAAGEVPEPEWAVLP
ncbi:MarR family transcriptional regulator [Pseudonocardia sp. RS11V-5]|uniref:MarR family winged helix-turn-helix transcriptional regulator n=1 Tax=Pseudonocardia terrae TaxID=2905831 RepID=UPI001E324EF7|nr:MarR family transcriptional regulator [Pseudonocardia terrae]MCE3551805.1 MarR family transcriptional regulator [Pseudonocardia terrae]